MFGSNKYFGNYCFLKPPCDYHDKPGKESAGKKFDQDKPRWDLLPYDAVEEAVLVLTDGAKKYGARNWEQGMAWSRPFAALMRHLWKWWQEETHDEESGRSHLAHALCELLFLIAYEKRGMIDNDDRPTKTINIEQ